MSERRVIDYSRYRVAQAIAEQWRAGDSAASIAANYFAFEPELGPWLVELIVAASDPKDRFAGLSPPSTNEEGEGE